MKLKIITLAAIAFCVIISCSKDGFSSTPQLTFKSVSTTTLLPDNIISISLEYKDKDGDVQGGINDSTINDPTDTSGGTLYFYKQTLNCINSITTFSPYRLPTYVPETDYSKGTITVSFSNGIINPPVPGIVPIGRTCTNKSDTCIFKFILKDRAGHRSDTVSSPQIVLVKP